MVTAVVKEPPSVYCGACRRWIVTNEIPNTFASRDGVAARVFVWRCPGCRGDVPAEAVVVAAPPKDQKAVYLDEKYGPYRKVASSKVVPNKVNRHDAVLACGHSYRVHTYYLERQVRCSRCRPS